MGRVHLNDAYREKGSFESLCEEEFSMVFTLPADSVENTCWRAEMVSSFYGSKEEKSHDKGTYRRI